MCAILSARVCGPGTASFTLSACADLNMLPAGRIDPNAVKLLQLFPAPNAGTRQLPGQPGPLRTLQRIRYARGLQPESSETRSSPASVIPTTRSSFLDRLKASPMAEHSSRAFRPRNRPRWWRHTRTYSAPTSSTRCAPALPTCTPRALDRWAARWGFRRNTESRVFPRLPKTAVCPPSSSPTCKLWAVTNTCPPTKPPRPSRSRMTSPGSTASTASRWASSSRTRSSRPCSLPGFAWPTLSTVARTPIFPTREARPVAWPSSCCLRWRRPRPSPGIRIPTASAIPAARTALQPPTSTRPTTRRSILPLTSRTTGR